MLLDRKLVLETGAEYYGTGFGSASDKLSELVFNTSMAGYQELLSDPSYTDQAVVMTYPLIGNYGIADDDYESRIKGAIGLENIVKSETELQLWAELEERQVIIAA